MVHVKQYGVHGEKLSVWAYTKKGRHLATFELSEDGKVRVHVPEGVDFVWGRIPKQDEHKHHVKGESSKVE